MSPYSVHERTRRLVEGRRVSVGKKYVNVIKIYKYADEIVQNTSQAKKKVYYYIDLFLYGLPLPHILLWDRKLHWVCLADSCYMQWDSLSFLLSADQFGVPQVPLRTLDYCQNVGLKTDFFKIQSEIQRTLWDRLCCLPSHLEVCSFNF